MAGKTKQSISIDTETLKSIVTQIQDLDTAISSAVGQDKAAKTKVMEQLREETQEQWQGILDEFVEKLNGLDERVLLGIVSNIEDEIKGHFGTKVEDFVKQQVDEKASAAKGNVTEQRERRKSLMENYKAMKGLLELNGIDVSDVPEPKRASGGGGGRKKGAAGVKAKGPFLFMHNGQPLSESQQSMSSLAFYATKGSGGGGSDGRFSSAELQAWIKEQGVNYPEDGFTDLELPNGHKISAVRQETEEGDEDTNGEEQGTDETAEPEAVGATA